MERKYFQAIQKMWSANKKIKNCQKQLFCIVLFFIILTFWGATISTLGLVSASVWASQARCAMVISVAVSKSKYWEMKYWEMNEFSKTNCNLVKIWSTKNVFCKNLIPNHPNFKKQTWIIFQNIQDIFITKISNFQKFCRKNKHAKSCPKKCLL